MAKARDEDRAALTARAQAQGIEVAPGQLAASGLDDSEGQPVPEAPPLLPAGEGGYFRVVHVVPSIPADQDSGRPDHVVRARDRANALERFNAEMGILGHDGQSVKREVTTASEADYLRAQAKRLGVDLREHRQHATDRKHPEHGVLTWQPPGGLTGKYKVTDKGELLPVE